MNQRILSAAVVAALAVPAAAHAGDAVRIYAKIHVSMDAYSNARVNGDTDGDDSGLGFSSNSSRLGFKGRHAVNDDTSLIWQYESQVDLDDGTGSLTKRNTFVGFKGGFGKVIAGNHDTPMKRVLTKWDPFNETVGEGRSVFGQPGDAGNTDFNVRARNSIMYWTPDMSGFRLVAQYSMDRHSGKEGDNNDNGLWDLGFEYKSGSFQAMGAYEAQSSEGAGSDDTAFRLSGKYRMGDFGIGALIESLDDSVAGGRNGYGLFATFKAGGMTTLKAAWYAVDAYDDVPDTGATVYSLGADFKLDKKTKLYAQYSALDQDAAADYRLGRRGHGDALRAVTPGLDPAALSVGLIYKF